ncbi:MFS transporter [Nonomuraea terrae]|uniref:MFS transporter n=1 Tax=Nonomuraea terrae TaxID=2530383 RepID=UPI001FEB8EA6|nr:MFS transporter [Nonomuraea terrae]
MVTHRTTGRNTGPPRARRTWIAADHPHYKWVALTNTTLGVLIASINSSIVLISLPAIFTGIRLDPLEPGNVGYLLWTLMGYMLVTAVLVVTLGRLGDMWGRVRIYNSGFVIFTLTSVVLSLDPFHGGGGALWLIGWRVVQAVGGAMLMANSAAIITDAFPGRQRGMALGVNMVAGIAGSFLGLVLGGVLAEWDWRSVFWVNVPIGVAGTVWAYRSLHETGKRAPGRMDWWGNITFAVGLTALLAGITYGGHIMGWTNPWVLAALAGGVAMLAVFCLAETSTAEPLIRLSLFRSTAFAGGNAATPHGGRIVRLAAGRPQRRAHRAGGARPGRPLHRRAAAGGGVVRRVPRLQPRRAPSRAGAAGPPAPGARRRAHRPPVLPGADLAPVPQRPGGGLRAGHGHGAGLRGRLAHPPGEGPQVAPYPDISV